MKVKKHLKSFCIRLGWIVGIIYTLPILPVLGILMVVGLLPVLALTTI